MACHQLVISQLKAVVKIEQSCVLPTALVPRPKIPCTPEPYFLSYHARPTVSRVGFVPPTVTTSEPTSPLIELLTYAEEKLAPAIG